MRNYAKYCFRFKGSFKKMQIGTIKILLLVLLNTLIIPVFSQEKKVSLDLKSVTLEEVFAEIEKQHDVVFIYRQELIDNVGKVSVFCNNANLKEILKDILVKRNLDFTERGRQIIITSMASKEEDAAEVKISGKITDIIGEPMPGAAILIKGTMKGAIADNDGNYIIMAPPNSTLIFSYLGYRPQEIPVLGRSAINIVMEEEAAELMGAELVVTGYQTLSKERSAGLYAKPDMDVLVSRPGVPNILQRLDGLVAGLTVNNAPSASQNSFLIRGLSTIGIFDNQISNSVPTGTNRNPLYVVDGIPIEDINTVNPQDVSDISILKDATAASIWGARASNGVIVITTKKGEVNEKINLEYNGYISFQGRPDLNYTPALDSRQFIFAANEIFNLQNSDNPQKYAELYPWSTISEYRGISNTGVAPHEVILYEGYLGKTSPQQTQARLDSLSTINNRGQIRDLWYREAMLTNHTLSASGGGKIHSFYGSFTYTNATDNRPQDSDNNFKINLRQDFRFSDRFKVYLITDLSNTLSNSRRNIAVDNKFYPYQLFRDQAGNNLSIPYMRYLSEPVHQQFQAKSGIDLDYNPLDEVNLGYTKSEDLHNRIVGGITLDILKGLRFEGTYGYIKGLSETKSFDDEKSYLVRSELVQFTIPSQTPGGTPQYGLPDNGGRYSVTNMSQTNWTVRNQLVYDMHWNNRVHQLTLLAGHEMQDQLLLYKSNTVRGYDPLLLTFTPIDYKTLSSDGISGTIMPNSGTRSTLMNDSFNLSLIFV